MALRGRKPTPVALKLVTGNPGKRALPKDVPPPPDGGRGPLADVAKPRHIKGRAAAIWDEVTAACWWLGEADVYAIGMFCALQAEYERAPTKMVAARIAQLRACRSELGLEPSARARLGHMKGARPAKPEPEKPKGPADYFDG